MTPPSIATGSATFRGPCASRGGSRCGRPASCALLGTRSVTSTSTTSSRPGSTPSWSGAAASTKATCCSRRCRTSLAAFSNLAGGAASDALVRRFGVKRGRRVIGAALTAAAAFTVAAMLTHHQLLTVVFLALTYGAITFQQSGVFGVCLDIGGKRAGAMVGLMNMIAQVGGLVGSVLYGYIVDDCQLQRALHPDGGPAAHRRRALGERRRVTRAGWRGSRGGVGAAQRASHCSVLRAASSVTQCGPSNS